MSLENAVRHKSTQMQSRLDGMSVEDQAEYLACNWEGIRRELLAGAYQPKPVKRVEIPKPNGGVRQALC